MQSPRRRRLDEYGLIATRAAIDGFLPLLHLGARDDCFIHELEVDGGAGPLRARLYTPAHADQSGQGLIYFHGGGFVVSSLTSHDALCRRLSARAGVRILSVGYRLAPEAPFPAQHEDALASARWAFDHATELGFDPARTGLGGDSAGGHMAAWTALQLRAEGRTAKGLLLFYPLLTIADRDWRARPLRDARIVGRAAVAYIRHSLGKACDPASFALSASQVAELPPVVLVSGSGLNPVHPDVERFAGQLAAAGVPTTRLDQPGLSHASLHLAPIYAPARQAIELASNALTALLA